MFMFKKSLEMPAPGQALPGRSQPIPTAARHFINGRPLKGPYPAGLETAMFGLGCFWGAERKFWELGDGVSDLPERFQHDRRERDSTADGRRRPNRA